VTKIQIRQDSAIDVNIMPRPEPPRPDTVLHGAAWLAGGYAGLQLFRFAANLVLARLVAPEVFGLMALVNLLLQGVHMVSDVGITAWVLQHRRAEDPRLLDVAWTVAVVRGGLIWLATALVAWPAVVVYGEPQLLVLLPAAGFTAVLGGFNSVVMITQARRLAQARLMLIQLIAYVASTALAIGWVWIRPTAWALVAGSLLAYAITLFLSHVALPRHRHRWAWDRVEMANLLQFGRWVFVGTLLSFLTNQIDRLVVGAAVSVATLGVYHVAAMFAAVPGYLAQGLAGNWLLPLFGRLQDHPEQVGQLAAYYSLAVRFGWLLLAGMAATAPAAVLLLYPAAYHPAGDLVRLLAWAAWFQLLQGFQAAGLMAAGQARRTAAASAVKLVALVPLAGGGAYLCGLSGMVVGFVLADLARYLFTAARYRRLGVPGLRADLVLTVLLALLTAAEWTASAADPLTRLLFGGMAVTVVGGSLVAAAWVRAKAGGK